MYLRIRASASLSVTPASRKRFYQLRWPGPLAGRQPASGGVASPFTEEVVIDDDEQPQPELAPRRVQPPQPAAADDGVRVVVVELA